MSLRRRDDRAASNSTGDGGRRDSNSVSSLDAAEYQVQVDAGLHDEAMRLGGASLR